MPRKEDERNKTPEMGNAHLISYKTKNTLLTEIGLPTLRNVGAVLMLPIDGCWIPA